MLTPATFTQHSIGSPSYSNQTRKRNKRDLIRIGKKEVKLSLFADYMILYVENPKDATKKLLDLMNEFGKFAGDKINIKNFVTFYTLIMKYQKEKLRNNPIYNHIKK